MWWSAAEQSSTPNSGVTVIYLDNAATTPVAPSVFQAMEPYFSAEFFNPSSQYSPALRQKQALEEARAYIAATVNAHPREIYFTSGGTESDNWALKGIALANREKGRHIIVSSAEHHAVLESALWLERRGFEITYAPVDETGRVDVDRFVGLLRPDTVLCSVMLANNEVGTVQPIGELAEATHRAGALFHTDAVQAYAHCAIDVFQLGVDALSVSAHKFNGPKGVGFLYCRRGLAVEPYMSGGAQERGYRAGTENLAGIVGMAQASRLAYGTDGKGEAFAGALEHCEQLRCRMANALLGSIPDARVNGHSTQRLEHILSVSFKDVSAETLLLILEQHGIYASAGSACASGSLNESHVLSAMGIPRAWARGTLRFSFSEATTLEDVDTCCEVLIDSIKHVRESK